jgi:predicted TIM-barrel fold metal-dependent hydrolase
MYGVRVCGEWKFRIQFDDPRCLELFHAAGEMNLPVVLHLDVPYLQVDGKRTYQPSWYGGTVANLERALQACPETTFIGHAPGFWREISGDADSDPTSYPRGPVTSGGRLYDLFDRYENLYADLSAGSGRFALERDPEHAVKFINRYSDRLLFARDYYEQDLHNFLQTLDLDEAVTNKIYFENALKLVPLK